jgi:hypothetical protein
MARQSKAMQEFLAMHVAMDYDPDEAVAAWRVFKSHYDPEATLPDIRSVRASDGRRPRISSRVPQHLRHKEPQSVGDLLAEIRANPDLAVRVAAILRNNKQGEN